MKQLDLGMNEGSWLRRFGGSESSTLLSSLAISLLVLCCVPVCAEQGRRDPETGRIRLIYIGDAILTRNPAYIYDFDPTFAATLTPACRDDLLGQGLEISEIYRYMRLYMPKTFEQMADTYDVVLLSDACVLNFRPEHLLWMEKCVRQVGLGLIMIGGYESFGGYSQYPSWEGTPVAEALPVVCQAGGRSAAGRYSVRIVDAENELMKYLPWRECPPFEALNIVKVKGGGSELARAADREEYPLMVDWDYGAGRTFAFTTDWTPNWGQWFAQWDYYLDFAANLGMYAAKVPVPREVALIHEIRTRFFGLTTERTLLASLFNFAETFGANVASLEGKMAEIDEVVKAAQDAYVEQEYEASLALLEDAEDARRGIQEEAMRLKDTAMMWVYLIEWSAVTGMSLFCGVILWLVMVRRRLYREVSVTRAANR